MNLGVDTVATFNATVKAIEKPVDQLLDSPAQAALAKIQMHKT